MRHQQNSDVLCCVGQGLSSCRMLARQLAIGGQAGIHLPAVTVAMLQLVALAASLALGDFDAKAAANHQGAQDTKCSASRPHIRCGG